MYSITINYKLTEYYSFLSEVSRIEFGSDTIKKWYFKVLSDPIWTGIYLFKLFKEGKCHFVFSETGFERKSKSGTSQLKWNDVGKVVDLPEFFLLVGKSKGMAPIPKRCLSIKQAKLIQNWAGNKVTGEL